MSITAVPTSASAESTAGYYSSRPELGYHDVVIAHRRLMGHYAELLGPGVRSQDAVRRRTRPWRWLTIWPLVRLYAESHVRRRLTALHVGYVRLEQVRRTDLGIRNWSRDQADNDLERLRSILTRYPDVKGVLGIFPIGLIMSVAVAGYGYVADKWPNLPFSGVDPGDAGPAIVGVSASLFAAFMGQSFLTKRALFERLGIYRAETKALQLVANRDTDDFAWHVLAACIGGVAALWVWRVAQRPVGVAVMGLWWLLFVVDFVCIVQLAWSQFLQRGYRA